MTIDDVLHFQQPIANTRVDCRSEFDLPRVLDLVLDSRSPFAAVVLVLAVLTAVALLLTTDCCAGAAAPTIPRIQS